MNGKAKILIVDDERIVRESLFHWFEEEGYVVDTAECGEAALKKFDKGKFDLFLLDMKMPGMSGIEQLKEKLEEIIKPDNLIGESQQMERIFDLIYTVAPTDTTVMIRGESGTGK